MRVKDGGTDVGSVVQSWDSETCEWSETAIHSVRAGAPVEIGLCEFAPKTEAVWTDLYPYPAQSASMPRRTIRMKLGGGGAE